MSPNWGSALVAGLFGVNCFYHLWRIHSGETISRRRILTICLWTMIIFCACSCLFLNGDYLEIKRIFVCLGVALIAVVIGHEREVVESKMKRIFG